MSSAPSDLTELIPLGMVIAISPLSIIPGILVLGTPRPRSTGIAFLIGWVLGIAIITAAFVAGADASNEGLDDAPGWAPYVRIGIGAALIVFGLYRWFSRHRSAHQPRWMTAMTSIGPARAFVTAVLLTVMNLKVFSICAAAGLAIGTAALGRVGAGRAIVEFTVIASSSVAIPVLGYLFAGERLKAPLARVKDWMERNHSALVAGILLFIGVALLYKGIHAL